MRPKLGFLGVGWIGRNRMDALAQAGCADIAAIADPSRERREAASALAPSARMCEHLGQLLEVPDLDGIVIATPTALHADLCVAALDRGLSVFCQKPLARTSGETMRIVELARARDRLLGVDLSYRHTAAMQRVRELVRAGELGRIFAVDLVFHNAYGPEASWFYDKQASGGGCVIDLGIHLLDLALWLLDFPRVEAATSQLYALGEPASDDQVEDYAAVQLRLAGDTVVRLTCSWRISAGRDCIIEAQLFGTGGGIAMTNENGSFCDFIAERYQGTRAVRLAAPPDVWGGRAAIAWAEELARGGRYDREANHYVRLAQVIDAIYGRGGLRCG
jgi:predicted dehydrogenase